MHNSNSQEYLEKIKNSVIDNLRNLAHAPSVQMTDVPRDPMGMDDEGDAILDDLDEDENPDRRHTKRRWDKYVEKDGELEESEDEEENRANGVHRQPNAHRRRNIMEFQNPNAAPDDPVTEAAFTRAANGYKGDVEMGDAGEEANGQADGSARSSTVNADEATPDEPMADAEEEEEDAIAPDTTVVAAPITNGAATTPTTNPPTAQEATPPASPPASPPAPTVATSSVAAPTVTNPPSAPVPVNGEVTDAAVSGIEEAEAAAAEQQADPAAGTKDQ